MFPLDCWNRCTFDELINYIYTEYTWYLGRYCRIQSKEQRHSTLSNIFLCGNLCEAVRFICEQETWVFFRPNKLALDETGVINETVAYVLAGKKLHDPPPCSTLYLYDETPILVLRTLKSMWLNCSCGNFWVVQALEVRNRKLYRGGF